MKSIKSNFKLNSLLSCMLLSGAMSSVAYAADETATTVAVEKEIEVIEITGGFRGSLSRGLFEKRHATNSKDTIMSEDIGKMPDLNLAESLQRVPGVAITREGGEGRNITVRGMGATYSQVTLNGMQIPASTGGLDSSGGVNRGRSFDFNMFGSELFGQMDINKTYAASLEEGGTASTVALHTLQPLANPGFHATGSVQSTYNLQNGDTSPRINGFVSDTFLDEKIGVLIGLSTSQREVKQSGFGTVRWTGAHVKNENWADTSSTVVNGTANPSANNPDYMAGTDDPLASMWVPRLPRTDSFNQEQSRNSFLIALQARPIDDLELSLNILDSKREVDVESYNFFAQFRSKFGSITPTQVTLDPSGRYIQAGSFSGVEPRSESRGQYSNSDFNQVVFDAEYLLTDTITLTVMAGKAKSEHHEEQYRYNLTGNATTFSYDFTGDSNLPTMSYGYDVTNPENFAWTGPHHRSDTVIRENDTLRADIEWEFDDEGSVLRGGFISNSRSIDSTHTRKADSLTDPSVASASNTNSLSSVVSNFGDAIGAPSGMLSDWLVADINVARNQYNAGKFLSDNDRSGNYIVTEDTDGIYVDADYYLGPVVINAGVRYVETTVQGGESDLSETYSNTLPALNLTYNVNDDLLLRAAWSKNVSRPNPQALTGQISGTPINASVSIANPGVGPEEITSIDLSAEWYFADESYIAVVYFQKEITNAITSNTISGQTLSDVVAAAIASDPIYAIGTPTYDPSAVSPTLAGGWEVTTSTNSTDIEEINGIEIAGRYVTEMGIGFDANYTYIDSDDIVRGLSKNAYNLGVFYENDIWSSRLFLNARDDYETGGAKDGNLSQNNTGPTRVDFSSTYTIDENFTATFDIINLTNESERNFTTGPTGDQDFIREFNSTGTELVLGLRATF